ncbi:MAG: tRNA preQ1(34) S-adenosylmethionine ribosyltransferase-isomerase QueA [Brevefilum sp.]|nr:tRNA preQ1(34) S-adenosylmethionine ribosyltransferase-isomerase QueA [Brevefilum sp.]
MRTADFDYNLPLDRIAQTPVTPRHISRLMVINRMQGTIEHTHFWEIGRYLNPGDILVVNETRVIPARIFANKQPGGGKVELLLLEKQDLTTWTALGGGKGLNPGRKLTIEGGPNAEIIQVLDGPKRRVRFDVPIEPFFGQVGHVPLPPYIHTHLDDPERYQTVYAKTPGSSAAPTAGLHFTPQLIQKLADQGIQFAKLTLHVGLDTFAPVTEADPREHKIHTEWCDLDRQTADQINAVRNAGGRVVAVGTTSVRTLETAAREILREGVVTPFSGPTDLFILPGYGFKAVDVMITNFHLPKSTLLMLVSAFAGRDLIFKAYQIAIEEGYRFYSFGDAMLIL